MIHPLDFGCNRAILSIPLDAPDLDFARYAPDRYVQREQNDASAVWMLAGLNLAYAFILTGQALRLSVQGVIGKFCNCFHAAMRSVAASYIITFSGWAGFGATLSLMVWK